MRIHVCGMDHRRYIYRLANTTLVAFGLVLGTSAGGGADAADRRIKSKIDAMDVLPEKQNLLQLYVTVREAARALASHRDIVLIDVRDATDVRRRGIASPVTRHIPIYVEKPQVQDESGEVKPATKSINPKFLTKVRRVLRRRRQSRKATVFVMCTAGVFSARAADLLAENGFTNVYSILEGFEGRLSEDGRRRTTGWRNSRLPWTAKPRPNQVAANF